MNNKLLDAMEQIDDAYIQSAQNRLNGVSATKPHRTIRRVLTPLIAAVVLLLSTFTVAMAANQEFRAEVLTFFLVAKVENVSLPEAEDCDDPSATQQTIDKLVKAQYIRMNGDFQYSSNNLLYQYEYDEEFQDSRPAEFWTIKDGQLVSVDITINQSEFSINRGGTTYRGVIDWCKWNGGIEVFTARLTENTKGNEPTASIEVSVLPGRTDKVILRLGHGRQKDFYCYYMLYDLVTEQVEDFLANTDVKNLVQDDSRLYDAVWNKDMSGAILRLRSEDEVTEYYLNMKTGDAIEIGALIGAAETAEATAVFADNTTLLLYQWGKSKVTPSQNLVSVHAYDIDSGKLTKTLNEVPVYNEFDEYPHGVILLGNHCPYCIVVGIGGQTQIVNQITGAVTQMDNFTFSPHGDVMSNPNGTKLLYFVYDTDGNALLQWSQLGVIDVKKGTFIADREVPATRDESIFWLDDNTVAVKNYSLEYDTVRGIYLYEF